MKIILISPSPPLRGGISDHNIGLYHKLSEKHDVEIFSFNYLYPKFFFPGKSQTSSKKDKFKNTHYTISSINPISWIKTSNKIKKMNPDVVIFSFWNPFIGLSLGSIAKLLARNMNKKKIISICHNIKPHEPSWFDKKLVKFYTNTFDKFIFMSSFVENELNEFKNKFKSVVRFLPFDIQYKTSYDKIKIAKEMGFSSKDRIILFTGLIRPYKGVDNLLLGTKTFLKKNKNHKLIIAGEAYEDTEKYKSIIRKNGIEDKVIWIDKFLTHSEIEKLMIISDVLILPYKSASQSGIVSKAWEYNLPIIANNVGGFSECIINGKSGYIVENNSITTLEEKVNTYFNSNDKNEMTKFILSNKHKFSWEYYISGIWELINES
tara:strand:- start:1248 stop:2378 length:1131 start_codon:yes stop_codon:yes gene_type:complete